MLSRFPDLGTTRALFAFTVVVSWLAVQGLAIGMVP